tara:strand:- start:70 stop:330 length:261 start_codon:yes stop_codon:yes gene_type:complete
MDLKFNSLTSQEITIDGETKQCLVAIFPILDQPIVQEGKAKKTGKEYKRLHAIEPYYLAGAGFSNLEGEWTITFQASRFSNENKMF